jgi:beta-galactosidase
MAERSRVSLVPGGLAVGGETVPLFAGSVHYWRLEREAWLPVLEATKKLGVRLVDTYVPWSVHETAPGRADFGQVDPRLDVTEFLRLVHKVGLWAIVRPGPHINAELTFFGIPERIVWDPSCQARSPKGNPVILPMVPVSFPVPSYASETFHRETETWYRLVAAELAPLVYPRGPIVLCQVDNEAAFYFRDGVYDQDYRPEAVAQYRAFLRKRYGTETALAAAYATKARPFEQIDPPTGFDAQSADELAYHLDWAEFQEHLLGNSLSRMRAALQKAGLSDVLTFHNLTMGHEATPLAATRIGEAVDLVGLDYYHRVSTIERVLIERRTTELATRSEGLGHPPFACEMGAGFPPYFFPILTEEDNRFTVLSALAYGLRGFTIYMAVDRDRWLGAPLGRRGEPRSAFEFWRTLLRAMAEVRFHELVRHTPVRIVVPALKRRLSRALHAFSPATPAFFALLGAGSRESCFEEDFGLGGAIVGQMEGFIESFEKALGARGIPFAHVDGAAHDLALGGASWILCPSAGGMDPELWKALQRKAHEGTRITIGPEIPTRGGALGRLPAALPTASFEMVSARAAYPFFDPAIIDELIDRASRDLHLPSIPIQPKAVQATVHVDGAGRPRVLFLINAGDQAEQAVVRLGIDGPLLDLFERTTFEVTDGTLATTVPPRTVRMFHIGR